MANNSLSRKVTELENNCVNDNITEDTCFIGLSEAPEAELELHKQARQICASIKPEDITPNERFLVEKSTELLTLRGFLLFRKMIKALNGLDKDSVYGSMFDTRLMWFLTETKKLGEQAQKMLKLEAENKGLNEDQLEDLRINLEDTFEDLFTPESWDKYELDAWRKLGEKMQGEQPENVV